MKSHDKASRKIGCCLFSLALLFAFSAYAEGSWAMYGGFGGSGMMNGGLRYSLNPNICFDGTLATSLGGDQANVVRAYADAFFLNQTVGITASLAKTSGQDTEISMGLAYALERPVSEKIAFGIAPTLISKSFTEGTGVDFLSDWVVYAVVGF